MRFIDGQLEIELYSELAAIFGFLPRNVEQLRSSMRTISDSLSERARRRTTA